MEGDLRQIANTKADV